MRFSSSEIVTSSPSLESWSKIASKPRSRRYDASRPRWASSTKREWLRADPNGRRYVERLEYRIDCNPVPILHQVGEIYGVAVDEDQVDFRVRNPEAFDHLLDRSAFLEVMRDACVPQALRQEFVELGVEAKGSVLHPLPVDLRHLHGGTLPECALQRESAVTQGEIPRLNQSL